MKKTLFEGACTALVTPFRDGKVDYDTMRSLLDQQIQGGVRAVVLCGTTGEAATLTNAEHEEIFNVCTEYINGRMTVICGVGSNCTASALNRAKEAEDAGADGILMVTPYYNKTNPQGLIRHFFTVADHVSIPMIVYNVPGRTGMKISPETYRELSKHPNINGVKEASGDLAELARSIALCGEELNFWSGNDADTVGMMAHGAKGVISVASNLLPEAVRRLCSLCLDGNFSEASDLYKRYAELFSMLFIEVNPIPIKAAMALAGLCGEEMRLPLTPLSEAHRKELLNCMRRLEE